MSAAMDHCAFNLSNATSAWTGGLAIAARLVALAAAATFAAGGGVAALVSSGAALGTALVLLRGCPMCWLVGLVEAIANRKRRTPPGGDGPCISSRQRTESGSLTKRQARPGGSELGDCPTVK